MFLTAVAIHTCDLSAESLIGDDRVMKLCPQWFLDLKLLTSVELIILCTIGLRCFLTHVNTYVVYLLSKLW